MTLELRPVQSAADLDAIVSIRAAGDPEAAVTSGDLRASRGFLIDLHDVIAWDGAEAIGFGYATMFPGWEADDWALGDVVVLPERRGQGVGRALHDDVLAHARGLGKRGLQVEAREDDPGTLGFLERRGYVEVERQQGVVLDLTRIERPAPALPDGLELVTRQPEHERAMYELSLEAEADIPGIDSEPPSFAGWRAGEIERPSKPAEFTFVALEAGEVVGYAALNVTERRIDHGLTVVRRDRRRRGIAGALKRMQIGKAIDAGFAKLYTESEERNVAMRTLNERLGYEPLPALIVLRGPTS